MKIVLIGGGAVGQCYAKALHNKGHQLLCIIDNHANAQLKQLCKVLNIPLYKEPTNLLKHADLVISAIYGSEALRMAKTSLPYLASHTLYADFTTAKPTDIKEVADIYKVQKIKFLDVALASTVNLFQEKTPLLVAGDYTPEFKKISQELEIEVSYVGSQAGAAMELKLLRSLFTKGCEALAVECLLAAHKKNLMPQFNKVLSDMDRKPVHEFLKSCVETHIPNANRRLNEVKEVIEQLKELGITPLASSGVENVFKRTVKHLETSPYSSNSFEEALEWLEKIN